jgi:hypothetical protein
MSKTNTWESDLLKLVFNNTTAAKIGDSTGLVGSTTAGSLYVSLHTADPGETGSQTTSEAGYTSYARVAVARSSAGWTISATAPTQAANAVAVTFPQCTGSSSVVTYVGIGTDATLGAGKLLYSGALGSSLSVSTNITPAFSINSLICTED